MRLLEEYVRSVLVELRVDRNFVKRLRRGSGPSLSSKARLVADAWIADYERGGRLLPGKTKNDIRSFAVAQYSALVFKTGDDSRARAELNRLIDSRFSAFTGGLAGRDKK
jgi:hypothetical protein